MYRQIGMYLRLRPTPRAITQLTLLGALYGCGDSGPPDPEPAALTIEVIPPGECRAGEPLENGIAGRVLELDPPNDPVAGVKVDFSGEGLTASSATSDTDGIARVGFTCPTVAGAGAEVVLSLDDGKAQSVASVGATLPGPPARFYKFQPPEIPEGMPVADDLPLDVNAFLSDQFGNPTSDVAVDWATGIGGGSLDRASNETIGPDAFAPNTWRFGPGEGIKTMLLTVPGTDVSHAYQVRAFAQPLQMIQHPGPDISATLGAQLPAPLRVQVLTPAGVPMPGVPVIFGVPLIAPSPEEGGVVTPVGEFVPAYGVLTDAQGFASVQYTLPQRANDSMRITVNASVRTIGSSGGAWNITLLPAPPSTVTIASGNDQAGQVGGTLALPLQVIARDQFGNPLCLPITWMASDGGSLASATTTPTGSACIASNTWTLGPSPGAQTVTATVAPNVSATFTASASP
jgi:hypothetical protein